MANKSDHKIAVLCYLFDEAGRVLLLHRRRPPNEELYSPIGGKVEIDIGESPTACAQREIEEEAGIRVELEHLHLTGMVSEAGYLGQHWLMFLYEVCLPMSVERVEFNEGRLEWFQRESIAQLPQPPTDRDVIWPLFWRFRRQFFAAHIDCASESMRWRLEQPSSDVTWRTVEPISFV